MVILVSMPLAPSAVGWSVTRTPTLAEQVKEATDIVLATVQEAPLPPCESQQGIYWRFVVVDRSLKGEAKGVIRVATFNGDCTQNLPDGTQKVMNIRGIPPENCRGAADGFYCSCGILAAADSYRRPLEFELCTRARKPH